MDSPTPTPNFERLREYRAEVDVFVFARDEETAEAAVKQAVEDMTDRNTLQASVAVVRERQVF